MNTLLVYLSKHGCTEKVAKIIKEKLTNEVKIINLKKKPKINFDKYETVIIGGSIHAGKIQKGIKNFINKNKEILLRKRLGLFLSCMEKGNTARKQFEEAYPEDIKKHAIVKGIMGGEFDFEKMNFLEKMIVKKVAGVEKSVSNIDNKAIEDFVSKL